MMSHSKPWLKEYPAGVPAEINLQTYPSLASLLEESFQRFADQSIFRFMNQEVTYRDLDQSSQALAAYLQAQGFKKGDRIALMMPNVPQYGTALAAVLRAGLVVVNVNPLYTPRELEHQLSESGAKGIIILENFASTLQAVIDRTQIQSVVITRMGDSLSFLKSHLVNFVVRQVKHLVPAYQLSSTERYSVTPYLQALRIGRQLPFNRPDIQPDDLAFLQYTGGTTGVSKGAMLLQRNIIANILQLQAWLEPAIKQHTHQQIIYVCALPLYHVFALIACYFVTIKLGGKSILIPNPRDLNGLINALKGQKLHVFPAVNTLYNALAHNPAFAQLDFSELFACNGGGMAVQQATADAWLKVTGCPIIEGYGLSETSAAVTVNPVTSTRYTGAIGLPISSTEVSIRDDDGNEVVAGLAGEICIRGPQVMAGYWQRPDETALIMTPDGFLRTGDIGVMDDKGYFKIVDRKKDMILVSGFNVYPTELEQVINQCPGVLECAVTGIPDEHSGEAVKAFIVKKDPALTEQDIFKFCQQQLTGYKRPKYIEFRTELPKSNVGKVLRRELRATQPVTATIP